MGSVFVLTWHSHRFVGGVMYAMNIKEREYKYDFFISTAYTVLCVGNTPTHPRVGVEI